MKIFHISDLHLCKNYKRNNIIKTRNLIRYFTENNLDHLVITGDISDNSNIDDWQLLKKLLYSFGIYHHSKVTVTIGNHDIYGGVQAAADILTFPSKCLKTNYFAKVRSFYNIFSDLFYNCSPNNASIFPLVKVVGNVAFIIINTIDFYGRVLNPFASNGKVYYNDFKKIASLLLDPSLKNKTKIILSHHHFYKNHVESTSSYGTIWNKIEKYTMKLRGKKKLIKLFSEGNIKYVLHGHSHELKIYKRKDIIFSNAGASVDNLYEQLSSGILLNTDNNSLQQVNLNYRNQPKMEVIKTAVAIC